MKPRALDLFCGAGGAAMGLMRAGFHVTGADIKPQPRYPGDCFIQADYADVEIDGYDFIWASPVCKKYSALANYGTNRKLPNNYWPDQIPAVRERLRGSGVLFCIENVERSPLESDAFLCGQMFGLPLIRHRLFETNFFWMRPSHTCAPRGATRLAFDDPGKVYIITGHGGGPGCKSIQNRSMCWRKPEGVRALGIDWMTRAEMAEAVPPIYAEFIGRQVLKHL